MGKPIKSRHYQKIIQKGSQMERLPSMMYLQKRAERPRWDWVSSDSVTLKANTLFKGVVKHMFICN